VDTFAAQASRGFGTLTGVPRTEVLLGAVIVVLVVVLLLVRVVRSRSRRRRIAAGSGYFDRDAAHFGPGGKEYDGPESATTPGASPGRVRYGTSQPTAPTFTASPRSRAARGTDAAHASAPPMPTRPLPAPGARTPGGSPDRAGPASTQTIPSTPRVLSPLPAPSMAEPPVPEPLASWAPAPVAGHHSDGVGSGAVAPVEDDDGLPLMPAPPPAASSAVPPPAAATGGRGDGSD
jgi:hypothetical protein